MPYLLCAVLENNHLTWLQTFDSLQDYPYTAEGDICKKTTCDVVEGTMVDKWIDVDHDNEEVGTRTLSQAFFSAESVLAAVAPVMYHSVLCGRAVPKACVE